MLRLLEPLEPSLPEWANLRALAQGLAADAKSVAEDAELIRAAADPLNSPQLGNWLLEPIAPKLTDAQLTLAAALRALAKRLAADAENLAEDADAIHGIADRAADGERHPPCGSGTLADIL